MPLKVLQQISDVLCLRAQPLEPWSCLEAPLNNQREVLADSQCMQVEAKVASHFPKQWASGKVSVYTRRHLL